VKDAEFEAIAEELVKAAEIWFAAPLHQKLQAFIAEARRSREEELRLLEEITGRQ
jgi:hypothetical protein